MPIQRHRFDQRVDLHVGRQRELPRGAPCHTRAQHRRADFERHGHAAALRRIHCGDFAAKNILNADLLRQRKRERHFARAYAHAHALAHLRAKIPHG